MEYTGTPLPSSESEGESVEYTGTPLPSSESEGESVEYTGSELTYDSPNGISLHFPIVAECDTVIKISIKVVNDDFILPEGYKDMDFVSSMFKITASADLPAPVTMRMEHCAVVEEDDSLVHMIAHGPPPYKFKPLEGGKFPIGECYGEIEMKEFSIITTVKRKLNMKMKVSVCLFEHNDKNIAHFVVTKDLTQPINAVKKAYKDHTESFRMKKDCKYRTNAISLTIPPSRCCLESTVKPAQIEIETIAEHRQRTSPPNIQLKWNWNKIPEKVEIPVEGILNMKSFKFTCNHGSSTPSTPSTEHASPLLLQATSPATSDTQTSPAPSTPQHRHDSSLSLSVESIALRRSNAIFTRAGDPDGLVTVLYSNFLLTPDEKAKALHRSLTARQKMEEIFQTMERRVSVNPSDFQTLLSVLKAEPATKALGEEMQGQ